MILTEAADSQRSLSATYSAEYPTVRDGSWRDVAIKTQQIPLPPQIQAEAIRREKARERREAEQRAEQERQEALRREEERRQAAIAARQAAQEAELLRLREREAQQQQAAQASVAARMQRHREMLCSRCGAPEPQVEAGRFSFCFVCGGDMVPGAATAAPPVQGHAAASARAALASVSAEPQRGGTHAGAATAASTTVAFRQAHVTGAGTGSTSGAAFHPAFCAWMGFFVPGLGQILNGQGAKGLLLLMGTLFLSSMAGFWGVTLVIARLLMALDAYRIAEKRRRGEPVGSWEWDIQ